MRDIKKTKFDSFDEFKEWFDKQKGEYLMIAGCDSDDPYGVVFFESEQQQVGELSYEKWKMISGNDWQVIVHGAKKIPYDDISTYIEPMRVPFRKKLERASAKLGIPRIAVREEKNLCAVDLSHGRLAFRNQEMHEEFSSVTRDLIDYLRIKNKKQRAAFWKELCDESVDYLVEKEKEIKEKLPNCAMFILAEDLVVSFRPESLTIALLGYRLFAAVGS